MGPTSAPMLIKGLNIIENKQTIKQKYTHTYIHTYINIHTHTLTHIGRQKINQLKRNANLFRAGLERMGCEVLGDQDSPVCM